MVDLGLAAKVRPCVVLSVPLEGSDRSLVTVIPHTTATRGSQFDVSLAIRFLAEGAFLVQGIQSIPPKYFLRRLGVLGREQLLSIEEALLRWQGIQHPDKNA